jgi:phasin family protein
MLQCSNTKIESGAEPMNATVKKVSVIKTAAPVEATVAAGKEAVEHVVKVSTEAATKGYEKAIAMSKEHVEAAVKAGTQAFKGYEEFVAFGKDNVEAAVKAGTILSKGVQDLNKVLFGLAQASLEDSVAASKKLLGCKSVKEVVEVQGELAKTNYSKLVAESRKISDLSAKIAEDAAAPIAARVTAAVEKFAKPLAA